MTRLIQLADLHFGVEDVDALAAAAKWIEGSDVDAIIVCGDLSQRGKRSEFGKCAVWLEQFTAPVLVTPGNHDTPLLDMSARALRPFQRFWRYFDERSLPLDLNRASVAGVNTARGWQARRNWAEGSVDLEDLANALDTVTQEDARVGVIACHHPFRSPREAPLRISTRRGERADAMMSTSRAQLLLTGHVHTPSAELWEDDGSGIGYVNLTSGTLSHRLRRFAPSFNVVDIGDDRIDAWSMSYENEGLSAGSLGAWSRENLEPLSGAAVPP